MTDHKINSKLMCSIVKGDVESVSRFIDEGVELLEMNSHQALLKAIKAGNGVMVKLLIDNGFINQSDKTLLSQVIAKGDFRIFSLVADKLDVLSISEDDLQTMGDKHADFKNDIADYFVANKHRLDLKGEFASFFLETKRLNESFEFMDRRFQETCQKMNELKSQLSSSNSVENPDSCNIIKRDSIVAKIFQLEKLQQVNSAVANQNIDWIKSNFFIDVSGVYAGENSDWQQSMIFRVIDNVIGIDFLTCVKNQGNLLRSRDDIRNSLDSLKEIKSLKEVLDVSAIAFLNDVGVKIIQTENTPEDTVGSYTKMSGVKLKYSETIFDSSLKSVLIHELWHQSMSNVFMNNNNPYKSDDQQTKAVYEEAIVKTLQKLGGAICPKNFDYNRSDSNALGKAIYNECYDVESENDFLTEFYDSPVYRCYNNIPHPSIDSIVENFMILYSGFYQEHSSHAEFIVRYEELIARGFSDNELEILSPLKEFIDSYIKPAMREYVNTHPLREYLIDQNTSPDGISILVKQDPEIIQQLAWCAENNL